MQEEYVLYLCAFASFASLRDFLAFVPEGT